LQIDEFSYKFVVVFFIGNKVKNKI